LFSFAMKRPPVSFASERRPSCSFERMSIVLICAMVWKSWMPPLSKPRTPPASTAKNATFAVCAAVARRRYAAERS
jgi:hypothetical protein